MPLKRLAAILATFALVPLIGGGFESEFLGRIFVRAPITLPAPPALPPAPPPLAPPEPPALPDPPIEPPDLPPIPGL